MTTFAHPMALLCGLLALPIIAVYLRKLRWRRQSTATGMFWERVFAADGFRLRWLRWRNAASLLVQLAFLATLVLALAGPPHWKMFAAAALAIGVLEWVLYHRRWLN